MLIGDFNAEESEAVLVQFLHYSNAVNITHENTCFKSITDSPNSFQSALTFCTGLSDFYKLVVTVLKISSEKRHLKKFITEIIISLMLMILKLN